MLGADLHSGTKTKEKFRIIYCEGESKDLKDSDIYQRIFPVTDGRKNIFISCGGGVNVIYAFFGGKDTAQFTFGEDVEVLAVVDRSESEHGFDIGDKIIQTNGNNVFTDNDRAKFHAYYDGCKMLERREIENYLFDPSVYSDLSDEKRKMDFVKDNVKDKINVEKAKKLELADKIREMEKEPKSTNNIYWQLHNCIFGSNGQEGGE